MGQIIVTALIAGAVTGLASAVMAPDGVLFSAVNGVIERISDTLSGF